MESGLGRIGYEEPLALADGRTITLLTSKIPLRNASGEITGVLGTYQDITERKQAEEALKNSEAMLGSVFQAVPHAILVYGPGRVIVDVNEAAYKVFGYPREEMIGRNSRFLYLTDEDYDAVGVMIRNASLVEADPISTMETRMRRKDGGELRILLSRAPLKTGSLPVGAVVAALDLTEHKRLETQVRQSQKMEAIGTLAGGIAHDFNNILSAIMGYTEMALADPHLQEPLQGYLRQVYQAGERASALVKQILTFSRQSEGQRQPLRVGTIVKEVLKLLRASLPSTIQIVQEIRTAQDTVLADTTQVHQILMNLCTNAAQALPERKGTLTVVLESQPVTDAALLALGRPLPPGDYLRLSVMDTGIGIPPELLNRIFDPFFTTKKKGEGTGMGLSVVHGIVTSHRGALTVESRPGEGSTFHVYLPCSRGRKRGGTTGQRNPCPGAASGSSSWTTRRPWCVWAARCWPGWATP